MKRVLNQTESLMTSFLVWQWRRYIIITSLNRMSKSQGVTNLQCPNQHLLVISGGVRLADTEIILGIACGHIQGIGVRSADSCINRRRYVILAQITLRHDNYGLKARIIEKGPDDKIIKSKSQVYKYKNWMYRGNRIVMRQMTVVLVIRTNKHLSLVRQITKLWRIESNCRNYWRTVL